MFLLTSSLFLQIACNEPTEKSDDTAAPEDTASPADTSSSTDTASPADTAVVDTGSPSDTADVNDELSLAGEMFVLRETQGETLIEALYIIFSPDGQSLSYGGVCNEHFGGFEILDDALHFTWGGSTEMMCEQGDNDQEGALIGFMEGTPDFSFDGNIITLELQGVTLLLDKYVPTPAVPLTGITWEILTYFEDAGFGDGSTTSTGLQTSTTATLRFEEDGAFAIFAGCNTGSGTYSLVGSQMSIDLNMNTDAECSDDDKSKEEQILEIVLNDPTYFIENYELRLESEGKGFRAYPEQ